MTLKARKKHQRKSLQTLVSGVSLTPALLRMMRVEKRAE